MKPADVRIADLPVTVAATRLVRSALVDAADAVERLDDGRDDEALHDFRVAVRRLRSVLRAYRPNLGKAASREVRRSLGAIAAATNECRDVEVQLQWLEGRRGDLRGPERAGLNGILRRLRAARAASLKGVVRATTAEFSVLAAEIGRRFERLAAQGPSLREVAGKRWRRDSRRLAEYLAAIRSAGDRESVHRARLCAKRVRYLIEPFREEEDGAAGLVHSLKELQDVLGDLHDAHVLEATLLAALDEASCPGARERRRDERPGLVALVALVRRHRDELFEAYRSQWTQARLDELVAGSKGFPAPGFLIESQHCSRRRPPSSPTGKVAGPEGRRS